MKIQVVVKSTKFTGGRQELFRHAAALAGRGHDVTLWVAGDPRLPWMSLDVPIRRLSGRSCRSLPQSDLCLFERPRFARPLCRAGRGIAVHFCQGFEGTDIESRIAAVKAGRGLVRGLPQLWNLWRRKRLIDRAYALPTAKIVVHHHLRDLIEGRYGQMAYFVPYGLPEGVFTPPRERKFGGQTILVVGPTDTGWKRVGDALEAVRLLKQRYPGLRLVRVAQHEQRPSERLLNVTDEYHTMIAPGEMAALYRRADVLVLASDATEGFGLPLLEAMACGAPAVVTDIPAFRTFAAPADFAHFVPVADPSALAATVQRLLDDRAERERLSERGPQVAAEYQTARSQEAMETALLQILEGSFACLPRDTGFVGQASPAFLLGAYHKNADCYTERVNLPPVELSHADDHDRKDPRPARRSRARRARR
jgi:glycosyltransferase involved in cell wall biosynthesis